jgi:probable O-glycosylation ligase (exosortase A-associated)
MLRMIFVLGIIAVGLFYSAQGPFYALLFYLWNAYFRPDDWTYGSLIRSLSLSYTIGVYLVIRTILSLPDFKLNGRTALIVLFWVQTIVGTVTSSHPEWSKNFFIEFTKVLLISYLIIVLVDDRKKLRITLTVVALSLGFECAKQGWANLIRAPGAKNDNPIPFLGDNNGVALGTMMLMPLFGALAQTATKKWERVGQRFLGIGVFLRGFSTYSRGGFLAASVLGVFTFVRSERKMRALLGLAAVGILVVSIMPPGYWARMGTIQAEGEERDESAAGRLHFWRVATRMAIANPLTGVGLNSFSPAYLEYNDDERFGGMRATHSTWFGVLADLGFPGLILVLANWSVAVLSCWRVSSLTRGDPTRRELRLYANALLTSLVVFAVAGSFLSSQYNEMLWHFVGLSTALYLITVREPATAKATAPVGRVAAQPVPALR